MVRSATKQGGYCSKDECFWLLIRSRAGRFTIRTTESFCATLPLLEARHGLTDRRITGVSIGILEDRVASYPTAFARHLSRLGYPFTGAVSWCIRHPLERKWVNAWEGSWAKRPRRDTHPRGSAGRLPRPGARRRAPWLQALLAGIGRGWSAVNRAPIVPRIA